MLAPVSLRVIVCPLQIAQPSGSVAPLHMVMPPTGTLRGDADIGAGTEHDEGREQEAKSRLGHGILQRGAAIRSLVRRGHHAATAAGSEAWASAEALRQPTIAGASRISSGRVMLSTMKSAKSVRRVMLLFRIGS